LFYNVSMNEKEVRQCRSKFEKDFIPYVRRPSRYIGGEVNESKKELTGCELSVALCFPDVYEIGMSHTGMAIIYEILNSIEGVAAERVFAPWSEAEKIMREKEVRLFSLESKAPIASFDIIGFSLTNELCYSNVLNMLDLAGLNVRSNLRGENSPIIIAGGSQGAACEPISAFIDVFLLGDGEEAVVELCELIKSEQQEGLKKREILTNIAGTFEWAYVPSLYKFEYKEGSIMSFRSESSELRSRFKAAVVEDLDNAAVPSKPIVPFRQAVHERISIEIMRGCPGRCRFCQASFCKRPIRYRSVDKIVQLAKECYQRSGFDTVSLLSLSTSEYPKLEELVEKLNNYFQDKYVGISLPSLRVDQQLKLIPVLVTSVRKSGLTIAVEAASERLRRIINKPLKDEDLFAAVESAYRAGWQRLKLYFMVGLPGEKENEIREIVKLAYELGKIRQKVDGKTGQINASVSWFVPKAHTPFGWVKQRAKSYFKNAREIILDEKKKLRGRFLRFKFHNIERSILESAMGRGNRLLCDVVEEAWRNGARFDLWNECFDYELWSNAFEKFNLDIETEAGREFEEDEILPWEHLDGPDKQYLLKHLRNTQKQIQQQ